MYFSPVMRIFFVTEVNFCPRKKNETDPDVFQIEVAGHMLCMQFHITACDECESKIL